MRQSPQTPTLLASTQITMLISQQARTQVLSPSRQSLSSVCDYLARQHADPARCSPFPSDANPWVADAQEKQDLLGEQAKG